METANTPNPRADIWELQREWLRDLCADTPALAQEIAEEVMDAWQSNVDEETKNGLIWDIVDGMKTVLLMELSEHFERVANHAVLQNIEAHSRHLAVALGSDSVYDPDRAALDNLRKSLHLVERLRPSLEKIFEHARPGIFTQIWRGLGDDIERMEEEWQIDGERLRNAFAQERPAMEKEIASVAEQLIQRLHRYYQQLIEAASAAS